MPVSTFLRGRWPSRGVMWLTLTATGRVLKRTAESDEGGGSKETYTSQGDIPCRIDSALGGGGEGEEADRIADLSTHLITLHPNTAVTVDDDFEIVGVGRFEILAIRFRTGEMVRELEVTART